jgi:hypothetical protein
LTRALSASCLPVRASSQRWVDAEIGLCAIKSDTDIKLDICITGALDLPVFIIRNGKFRICLLKRAHLPDKPIPLLETLKAKIALTNLKKHNIFVETAASHPVTGSSNYDKDARLLMSQMANYSVILRGDKIWKHTGVHT